MKLLTLVSISIVLGLLWQNWELCRYYCSCSMRVTDEKKELNENLNILEKKTLSHFSDYCHLTGLAEHCI